MTHPKPQPAVKTAVIILNDALNPHGIYAGTKMPKTWPHGFIRVDRAGGGMRVLVTDFARILCECYGASIGVVEDVTGLAIQALTSAEGEIFDGVFVRGFENIEGPVNFPQPIVPDLCRWQFQGDLLVSTN